MGWDDGLVNEMASREAPVPGGDRILGYAEAINEAFREGLKRYPESFVFGQGVPDPSGYWGATQGLADSFGGDRVFDTPLSEEACTGVAVGAAISGKRPILMHNRPDFILLSMNQLVTHASKLSWMDNGKTTVPLVIWSAIGRGWGSGAQHSQAIQGLLLTVPGLKIVMPSTPYDSKGLLLAALRDNNPVLIFEHRWCMRKKGHVPEGYYEVPLGKGILRREGKAITIVGTSHALDIALEACTKYQIDADVIDLRSIKPWDKEMVFESVEKTGRLLVVDTGWEVGGVCAEILSVVAIEFQRVYEPPALGRVGLPDCPTPAGYDLEMAYYPNAETVRDKVSMLFEG